MSNLTADDHIEDLQDGQDEEQDWLDRAFLYIKQRPRIWMPLAVVLAVVAFFALTSQGAAQPIGTDPTTAGQPLSNPEQHLHSFAIDPHHPGTILLGSHFGLFTSTDDGATWPEKRGQLNTLMMIAVTVNPGDGSIGVIGLDPGGGDFGHNGVYISHDDHTWIHASDPPGIPHVVNRYSITAGTGGGHDWLVEYVNYGLYETSDDGKTWRLLRAPVSQQEVVHQVVTVPGTKTIFIASSVGLLSSADDGHTWHTAQAIGPGADAIAVSTSDPGEVIVSADSGIWQSQNGGASFTQLSGLITQTAFVHIVIAPHQPALIYALGGEQGVWRSTNGGMTWAQISTLTLSNPRDILVAPNDDKHLYIGFYSPAIAIASLDGGLTWQVIAR